MDTQIAYQKFEHPDFTAKGENRASVPLISLKTLWFNTGSLCNLACQGCYMESSPTNDALLYFKADDVRFYLDQIKTSNMDVNEIAFTGGEPFMNPEMIEILEECLSRGFQVLVLSNAMKPLAHKKVDLLDLKERYGNQLGLRVSVDHYSQKEHESLRGENAWEPMLKGLSWLSQNGFKVAVAGRTLWHESEMSARAGYQKMFEENNIAIDHTDPISLVLLPEMDEQAEVPEITTACWDILGVRPEAMMCATSRMIVKRKGDEMPVVMPCTLLPYDDNFIMGTSLEEAKAPIKLNHPHCSKFCVLGGGSCSKSE